MKTPSKKTILVTPLNWGLGHATRCIPIINGLLENGFDVLLGGDGASLELLKQEFPELLSITLPSYNITYPKEGKLFKRQMLFKLPHIYSASKREQKAVKKLVTSGQVQGIISDNRLGVRNKNVPSVYITHQLRVLSGSTTLMSSKMHQKYISKFDTCWVPDYKNEPNLSGKLGHLDVVKENVSYIGPLSRMKQKEAFKENDILVILSGPEPQRTLLEKKLLQELAKTKKKVLLVRGVIENIKTKLKKGNITIVNYLTTPDLEKALNASELIISRSGYTTIMDLASLNKKAFFIPTPGQFEQEYLAKKLHEDNVIPSCNQDTFTVEQLALVDCFSGWHVSEVKKQNFVELFSVFQGEGELTPYA